MEDSLLITILLTIVCVLLVIDIVIAVTIYQIIKKVKLVVSKTEHVVDNVSSASKFAKNVSVSAALGKIVQLTAEQFGKKK